MLPFIAIGGLAAGAGIVALITNSINEAAGYQERQWERKRRDLSKRMDYQNSRISHHMSYAKQKIETVSLKADRRAMIELSSHAYQNYKAAKQSLKAYGKVLKECKQQIQILEQALQQKTSKQQKEQYRQELTDVRKLRRHTFDKRDILREQKDEFYSKLKELNKNTAELRDRINACYIS